MFTGALNKHLHMKPFIKINIQGSQRPDTWQTIVYVLHCKRLATRTNSHDWIKIEIL